LDVDGDGLEDVITARATKPIVGRSGGELMWYKQPDSNPLNGGWKGEVITNGPDVYFRLLDHDNDASTAPAIIAAEFFSTQLTIYYTTEKYWANANSKSIKKQVIDTTIGPVFDIQIVDLNNDGNLDLLVTNHVDNATLSGVYAYEIPKDFTSEWPKHVLANDIPTLKKGNNQASPGEAQPIHAKVSDEGKKKPYILLAGDGAEKAFLLTAKSEDHSDWTYDIETVLDAKGTVGQPAVGDADGDGYNEFFVPDYDNGYVYGYTFSP